MGDIWIPRSAGVKGERKRRSMRRRAEMCVGVAMWNMGVLGTFFIPRAPWPAILAVVVVTWVTAIWLWRRS